MTENPWFKRIMDVDAENAAACQQAIRTIQQEYKLNNNMVSKQLSPSELVQFLHYASKIKETPRTGWRRYGIEDGETVACHMYRMALMAMVTPSDTPLDKVRCMQMALVHDLAEAIVGDLTPDDPIDAVTKHRLEAEAMAKIVGCLGGHSSGTHIMELFREYEEGKTAESRHVHELDKVEMALQALEYEGKHGVDLQPFWNGALSYVKSEYLSKMLLEMVKQRPKSQSDHVNNY